MPKLEGIAFTLRLLTEHPDCAVIVLSLHNAAAARFVSNHDGPDALVDALFALASLCC